MALEVKCLPRAAELVNCKNGICPSPAAFSLCHSGPISSIFESLSFTTTLSCLPLSERTRPLSLALPFRDSRGSAETLPGAVWLLQCIWRLVVCCVFAQLCPALCDPTVCSLPSTSVRGISQALGPRIELVSPALAGGFLATREV